MGCNAMQEQIQRPKGATLARLAGRLCQQPVFIQFFGCDSPEDAAEFIRATCGVQSRAELDHNPEAAALFHKRVRKPFVESRA